jgi:hypothetical protein
MIFQNQQPEEVLVMVAVGDLAGEGVKMSSVDEIYDRIVLSQDIIKVNNTTHEVVGGQLVGFNMANALSPGFRKFKVFYWDGESLLLDGRLFAPDEVKCNNLWDVFELFDNNAPPVKEMDADAWVLILDQPWDNHSDKARLIIENNNKDMCIVRKYFISLVDVPAELDKFATLEPVHESLSAEGDDVMNDIIAGLSDNQRNIMGSDIYEVEWQANE